MSLPRYARYRLRVEIAKLHSALHGPGKWRDCMRCDVLSVERETLPSPVEVGR